MTKPHFKIHDPKDSEMPPPSQPTGRSCPFRSAAVPQQSKHPITGEQVVSLGFVSGPCVKECAGYDRAADRSCFDRGFALFATHMLMTPAPVLNADGTLRAVGGNGA